MYPLEEFMKIMSSWFSSTLACQEKEQIEYLEYSFLMITIHYISLEFRHFRVFFENQSGLGVTQLVIKPFRMSQTSRIVSLG